MKYHDFHLESYSVSDFGKTITLNLLFNYPKRSKATSIIKFNHVIAYHFIHTGGAIITQIDEAPLATILKKFGISLLEWSNQYGGPFLEKNLSICQTKLETERYKAWSIESAIGFEGFVIAKNIK